ncbi:MAG TPA: hypothetical protein VGK32_06890 [Vicinamibacterales bacterium]|jgi:hypothetical protein
MSISSVQASGANAIQDLARTIMQEFDKNQDGQFSYDEFANFLDSFVQNLGIKPSRAASASSSTAGKVATASQPFVTSLDASTLPPCPPGWNGAKWTDLGHTTPKYVVGRILARYSPSDWLDTAKRDTILGDLKAAGFNVTAVGKDKVDFGSELGKIDIVQGASSGGQAWQWLPVS